MASEKTVNVSDIMGNEKIRLHIKDISREDVSLALKAGIAADKHFRHLMTQTKTVTFGKFKCHETDKGTIVVTYAKS